MWGLLGAAADYAQTQGANHEAMRESRRNRNFQERMSNTAYTRAAKDLERAGLNRALALGSPASSPSGAMAAIQKPDVVKSGALASTAKQQIAQSKAEENLINQKNSESQASEQQAIANTITAGTQADLNKANAELARESARRTRLEADKQERYNPVHKKVGEVVDDAVTTADNYLRNGAKDDVKSIITKGRDFISNTAKNLPPVQLWNWIKEKNKELKDKVNSNRRRK